jgi:antitoxin CcdA
MRLKEDRAGYLKRAANLSVNAELLDQAKALEINLSATFERALEEAVRARRREQWLAENRDAIAAYNERIERDGMFSDSLRSF